MVLCNRMICLNFIFLLSFIGTVLHEMLHVMGFTHEQSRFDRNDFIDLKLENLREESN